VTNRALIKEREMIERFEAGPRMSQAVSYPASGKVVVLAGQVGNPATADVVEQTKEVIAKIDSLLAQAGADKTQIVSATIWLRDIADFAKMNTVWDAWVPQGHTPARACVEAKLALPELLVEIQVTAVVL
jgi:enamine deaminase RidA (YjgF/YER057c/UK114 family)